jgi:hypothetical protein
LSPPPRPLKDGSIMQQIFISYSRLDEPQAMKLYNSLSKQGFSPWLDKVSLLPGQTWESEIKNAIQKSSFVILLLSNNSLDRQGYFHKEIRLALDVLETIPPGKIFLIPALLDSCEVPQYLKTLQWADLFTDWDDGFSKMLRAMYSQRTKDMLSKPIEDLSPLPHDLKIIPPAKNLPPNILALSGHWTGRWGRVLPSQLIIEKIEIDHAIVVYSWGEHVSGKFKEGWNREHVNISTDGMIEFGEDVKFTFTLDKTGNRLLGTRKGLQGISETIMTKKEIVDDNQDITYELLGHFLAEWVEIERTLSEIAILNINGLSPKYQAVAHMNTSIVAKDLVRIGIISPDIAKNIAELRDLRNMTLHGADDFRKTITNEIIQKAKLILDELKKADKTPL